VVVFFFLATITRATSYSLLAVTDQANDGDFCNSIYSCNLSVQEISFLSTQDNQGYQIKDHTDIFLNGAWPQIYFAPDRYLEFEFINPNLSVTDTILSSSFVISHQINQVLGSKGTDHDIKLEASKDGGSTWEILFTNLWPTPSASFVYFQISLPSSYLNASSLNNLLTRLSIYGDDGYANLSSILDLVELNIDYYNSLTNTPPVNTISAPSEDQQLKGDITFTVSLTDDFGITESQLNLLDKNQNLVTTCLQATISSTTSLSVSCQIDSTNYSNGQYYLQVKTKDNADEYTENNRLITIENAITTSSTTATSISSTEALSNSTSNTRNPLSDLATLINSTGSVISSPYSWQPTKVEAYNPVASISDSPSKTKILGATTQKPKTWMLVLSIFISSSYLLYLLSRLRKI